MPDYIVNYDLRNKCNYDALYQKLAAFPNSARTLESTWFVPNQPSADHIAAVLLTVLDADDGLQIDEKGKDCFLRNPDKKSNALARILQDHILGQKKNALADLSFGAVSEAENALAWRYPNTPR